MSSTYSSTTTPYIYLGTWTNWSNGRLAGATLTLNQQSAGYLTAFVAIFVTIVGARLWAILCFVVHQARSVQKPEDGLYHQQQAVFAMYTTPGGVAWAFLQQAWSWRGKARSSLLRTLSWAIFALAYMALIGLAAVFSSEISKSPGTRRLIIGDCGEWDADDSIDGSLAAVSWSSNITNIAASYARACYDVNYDPVGCGRYPVPALNWTINRNITCPFDKEICSYGGSAAAVNMTTAMIDSHEDLGINAPRNDRVLFQKSTSCAPLRQDGYVELRNKTTSDMRGVVGDTIAHYKYGSTYDKNGRLTSNDTYTYNTHTTLDSIPYTLKSIPAANDDGTGVRLIPALNRTDADVTLIFISANSVFYTTAVADPVFSAHKSTNYSSISAYQSDAYSGLIGCSEQVRICNPSNGRCTPFQRFAQLVSTFEENTNDLKLNLRQNATALRVAYESQFTIQFYVTVSRDGSALRASDTIGQIYVQRSLPANQWQIEVIGWFTTGLARLQEGIQQHAASTANVVPGSFFTSFRDPGTDAESAASCMNQIVNNTDGTISFSIVGLAVLLTLGSVILIVSFTVDVVVGLIQQKLGRGLHKRMEWRVNCRLQTHMMLLRELRLGEWGSVHETIPTTTGRSQKFWGPAEVEIRSRGHTSTGEGETGVQLVGRENTDGDDNKGWIARETMLQ